MNENMFIWKKYECYDEQEMNLLFEKAYMLKEETRVFVARYTGVGNASFAEEILVVKRFDRRTGRAPTVVFFKLQAPCVLYIRTDIALLSRERFLYI